MDVAALERSLLPCPFCGCRGILERKEPSDGLPEIYFVRCSSLTCGCADGICRHRDAQYVVDRWNQRALSPPSFGRSPDLPR